MSAARSLRFRLYLVTVIAGGVAAIMGTLALSGLDLVPAGHVRSFWICVLLLFLGETRPHAWFRRGGGEITPTWTFAFALLLIAPPAAALLAVPVASLMADRLGGKDFQRYAFNAAQLALSLGAGAVVLHGFGGRGGLDNVTALDLRWLFAATMAGATMFCTNALLTAVVISLHQGRPAMALVRDGITHNLTTDGMLLALAPILVVIADQTLVLVPPLLITAYAVYRAVELALAHEHEATHDLLTGLPNRRLFFDDLTSAMQRRDRDLAVALIDLDNFKAVNDRLGHGLGDLALIEAGRRIETCLGQHDIAARLGGDEFAIVLGGGADRDTCHRRMLALLRSLCEPMILDGVPVTLGASIGVAMGSGSVRNASALLHRADVSMYSVKQAGGGVRWYDHGTDHARSGRIELLGELRDALDQHHLILHYQPKIDLNTNMVHGVEALVRWQHHRLGLIPPADFITIAENTDLIGALTEYVMAAALTQCAAWRAEGLDIPVAVNVSAANLTDLTFPETVRRLLEASGLDASCLEVEITENSVFGDLDRSTQVLRALRTMGVRLSIDDFGTGFSSLAHLRDLPVQAIKVDRSFVRDMLTQAGDAIIVRSILELARSLDLETVAEGVEDLELLSTLQLHGCTLAQGFAIARPAPAQELTPWLHAQRAREAVA